MYLQDNNYLLHMPYNLFLLLLNIFQHRNNIANLINGCEKKTYLSKKKMPAEIPPEDELDDGDAGDKDKSEQAKQFYVRKKRKENINSEKEPETYNTVTQETMKFSIDPDGDYVIDEDAVREQNMNDSL